MQQKVRQVTLQDLWKLLHPGMGQAQAKDHPRNHWHQIQEIEVSATHTESLTQQAKA